MKKVNLVNTWLTYSITITVTDKIYLYETYLDFSETKQRGLILHVYGNIIYIADTAAEHEGRVVVTIKLSLKKINTKLFLYMTLAFTEQNIYLGVRTVKT